jgi:hypothetical protein
MRCACSPSIYELVNGRPMGVAVDHAAHGKRPKALLNGGRVDVHDLLDDARGVRLTAGARLMRQALAGRERQAEEAALPLARAHAAAQRLIGVIVGAQRIAMRQEHAFPVELDDGGIGEEFAPRAPAEIAPQEEIAVAVNDEHGDAREP